MILDLERKADYETYRTPEWAFHIVARCPSCGEELARVEAGDEASIELESHECPLEESPSPATEQATA